MPVKRRAAKHRTRITAEAVAAFADGDWQGLHLALNLRPWEANPLDVVTPEPPAWDRNSVWAQSWPRAWHVRSALETECSEKRRFHVLRPGQGVAKGLQPSATPALSEDGKQ